MFINIFAGKFGMQVNGLLIGRDQCSSLCQKRRSERMRKLSDNILDKPCRQNTVKDPTKEN